MSENSQTEPNEPAPKPPLPAAALFFLALASVFAIAYGGWKWGQVRQFQAHQGDALPAAYAGPPLTEFDLTERSGKPFRSADMKGKVWVATYFFTTCPGNCLRLNQSIQGLNMLPELKDVTWVSITCDPDTDNLKELRDYADRWHADPDRWLFVRGDLDYTKRVAAGMNLALMRKGHQDYAIVVDKAGKIRGMFDATSRSQSERLAAKLIELQKEEPPQEMAASHAEEKKAT